MRENSVNSDEVIAYEPDHTLRNILGEKFDAEKYFKGKIADCQKVIDAARDEFFEDEKPRVLQLKELAKSANPEEFAPIISVCNDIRGQARIFGFSFISHLCSQIILFAELEAKLPKLRYLIISKLIEALSVAIFHKIKDEGEPFKQNSTRSWQRLSSDPNGGLSG